MGTLKAVNPTDKWKRLRAAPSVQPLSVKEMTSEWLSILLFQ